MGEADDAAGDLRAAGLLLALYTLQGIPMGLSGAVPLLLAGRASYAEQALLSLASLPFSLKLLWAPLVDAAYVRRWGRRKTWLVPTQLLIGATMLLSRGRVDAWVAAADPTLHVKQFAKNVGKEAQKALDACHDLPDEKDEEKEAKEAWKKENEPEEEPEDEGDTAEQKKDRLEAGRRIFVLTPQGEIL